jgi:Tfp pilus assembly protein PilO
MARQTAPSLKKIQIDKANSRMVAIIAAASFVTVFSLVAAKALISQQRYQSRVISAKGEAVDQLKKNIAASKNLENAYGTFVSQSSNVLGGNPQGTGDKDGDNGKIVLDALPSKYDFPALTTSLEKILSNPGYKIESITGVDDEANQQNSSGPNPTPIEIPFQIGVSGTYASMQTLVDTLQHSIRPFQIQTISLTGADNTLHATINAKTFYQPEKTLTITTKEIK